MALLKRALPKAGAWPRGLGMSAPGTQEPALGSTFLGSNPFSTGTHRSVQAVGCQHPACHPGSGPCSVGSPQSQQALTLLSLKDLLSCKEAQEEKKNHLSYHVQQLSLPWRPQMTPSKRLHDLHSLFGAGGVRAALPPGAAGPSMLGKWGRVLGKQPGSDGWLYTLGEFCSTCMFYIYIRAL